MDSVKPNQNSVSLSPSFRFLLVCGLYLLIQAAAFRTGTGSEEFIDLWVLRQMREGHLPFRDFIFDYGPLGPYLWYSITKLIGLELFAMRLAVIALGIPAIWINYKIASRFMSGYSALLTALACWGIITFPLYSFNHSLSVLTLSAAIYTAIRYLDTERSFHFGLSVLFCILTFLIRPLPTGAVLTIAIPAAILFSSFYASNRRERILRGLFYPILSVGGVLLFIGLYTLVLKFPLARWSAVNLSSPYMNHSLTVFTPKFPNLLRSASSFINDIGTASPLRLFKTAVFLNLLAGNLAYWIAFLLPFCYLIYIGFKSVVKRSPPKIDPAFFLLLLSSVGLGLHFHNFTAERVYPDFGAEGAMWNWIGGFLLQPGMIAGFVLIMRFFRGRAAAIITMLSLYLVLAPKLFSFRSFFIPMESANIPGIRHILLNQHYAHAVVPAVQYLNENQSRLPKTIFSVKPEFQILAFQKPAFPEYYYMGMLPEKMVLKPGVFPGIGYQTTVGDLLIKRLDEEKPVIALDSPLEKIPARWAEFALNHYKLDRRFKNKNRLLQGLSSSVLIYLPSEKILSR